VNNKKYWDDRSIVYNNLNWVGNEDWLEKLIIFGEFGPLDSVLDLGTGTGVVAKKLISKINTVVALDISKEMLSYANFPTAIKTSLLDIENGYCLSNFFNKIISRMCFHYLQRLDKAIDNCKVMLKKGGSLIVSESVPPSDDPEVILWWGNMFLLKEKRHIFTKKKLISLFKKHNFKNIQIQEYVDYNFDIINWIVNQNVKKTIQHKIIKIHKNAPDKVLKAHNIRDIGDKILINSRSIHIKGNI